MFIPSLSLFYTIFIPLALRSSRLYPFFIPSLPLWLCICPIFIPSLSHLYLFDYITLHYHYIHYMHHIHYMHYIPLHAIAYHYIPLHTITYHYMPLHAITCHYIPLGPVAIQVKGSQRPETRIQPKVRLFRIEYFIQGGEIIHFYLGG